VGPEVKKAMKAAAKEWFAPFLEHGLYIDAVTWFAQDQQNGDFRWVECFELGTSKLGASKFSTLKLGTSKLGASTCA
jgi:hypothetical protein